MSTIFQPSPASARRLRVLAWGSAACLLLVPAIAMRLRVPGVYWTGTDFAVMGALLAGTCILGELAMRRAGNTLARAGFALALATAFLTIWVNLAVGMSGAPGDPRNLLFAGVLLVAAAGTWRARCRSSGMQWVMATTALAQMLAAAAAVVIGALDGAGSAAAAWSQEALPAAAFALPWLAAALLFRRADAGAGRPPRAGR